MNKDQVEGSYKKLKGKIKESWGKLTDDEIAQYDGAKDQFFGAVQTKYGIAKEKAQDQLREWERECGCDNKAA